MIINKILDNVFRKLESGDTDRISRKLDKEKPVEIGLMNSKRYYSKGSNGHYSDEDAKSDQIDEYEGETEVDIPSTAIDKVDYDPKTRVCNVKYVNGDKWYRFENMSPQQFKTFMNASSKGRYVEKVMRVNNRAKGY